MKLAKILFIGSAVAAVGAANAVNFGDSVNDVAVGTFPHIDITSVDVTNTIDTITFRINLNGDPVQTNWGKYMIALNTGAGGDTTSNGWARPYGMTTGMDYWVGAWADDGGQNAAGQLWAFGSGWGQIGNPTNVSFAKDTSSFSVSVKMAAIGASMYNQLCFDVVTSGGGGGDGAVDSVSNPNAQINNWGDYSVALNGGLCYTPVPEPASMAFLGAGAIALIRRRRSK